MSGKPTYEELLERIKELEKEGSELHNAEKELQKSKAMLRAVVDSLPFDVFALDSYNRYFLQNSICMKNWGDVIGKYPENLPVNKETLNLWMDNNCRALSGETVVGEVEYNRLEGGKNFYYNIIAPIRDEEKIFGILGVLVDISDQKQAEEALRESEERYRSLAENSMVGFWQITLEGYTAYINPAMCSMIEIEGPEALSGQTYHSFFTPKSLETIDRERSKPLKGKGSSYEVVIVGKNGGRRNVVICGASLFSAEGELQGYIATFTDITARKRAENALQKAHDQLEHRVKERTRELEIKTNSLEEINTAMNILLKKREEDKKELEDNVLTNVKKLVEPYFEMIKKTKLDDQQETFLSIIESNLKEIISPFTRKMSLKYLNLTPTEIRIANLIRHGSPSRKIAKLMNVSPRTIDTHRKNIRRKIGLQGQRGNLRSHLLSLH